MSFREWRERRRLRRWRQMGIPDEVRERAERVGLRHAPVWYVGRLTEGRNEAIRGIAERDGQRAEVGVTDSDAVTEADSSPAARGAHLSPAEAFAECLRVAENKHQKLAALRLLDACKRERERDGEAGE